MLRPFIVATNADYTLLVVAENENEAIDIAVQYTLDAYDEERDDWEAYELLDFMGTDEVIEL